MSRCSYNNVHKTANVLASMITIKCINFNICTMFCPYMWPLSCGTLYLFTTGSIPNILQIYWIWKVCLDTKLCIHDLIDILCKRQLIWMIKNKLRQSSLIPVLEATGSERDGEVQTGVHSCQVQLVNDKPYNKYSQTYSFNTIICINMFNWLVMSLRHQKYIFSL